MSVVLVSSTSAVASRGVSADRCHQNNHNDQGIHLGFVESVYSAGFTSSVTVVDQANHIYT